MNALALVATLIAAPPTTTADPKAAAKVVEEKAFAAVEANSWCPAMFLFLDANEIDPSPDYIFNAAQAAEAANDGTRAVELYTKVVASPAKTARKGEAKKRIGLLTTKLEKSGAGESCAPPAPPVEAKVEAPPPPPAPPPAPPPPRWPLYAAGGGAAVAVVGAGVAVVGALPYLDHESARSSLLAAEEARSTDGVAALFAKQESARANWESWGALSTTAGLLLVAAGLAVAGGGAAFALAQDGT